MLSMQATIDMSSLTVKQLAERYRCYLNNFITIDAWAYEYHLDKEDAESFLELCKAAHEAGF